MIFIRENKVDTTDSETSVYKNDIWYKILYNTDTQIYYKFASFWFLNFQINIASTSAIIIPSFGLMMDGALCFFQIPVCMQHAIDP